MKRRPILIFIVALIFFAIAILMLKDDIFSPYVPIEEAMRKPGSYVQIIGNLEKTSVNQSEQGFSFVLIDADKKKINVKKSGIKPLNFEHSEQVVILGRYQKDEKYFNADKVLTKCPSRYKREK